QRNKAKAAAPRASALPGRGAGFGRPPGPGTPRHIYVCGLQAGFSPDDGWRTLYSFAPADESAFAMERAAGSHRPDRPFRARAAAQAALSPGERRASGLEPRPTPPGVPFNQAMVNEC